ncbi:sensor histidine kinase [Leptolyngbya sp. CCNP1308]|uniref:sensor histidine kinase n=1 Tax=Leptolyngbya sp. CCNP1308 TaxID=3110255 RepID=UPI002B20BC6E|nr:sensor histidine kinase [Leptolyngbya sp. CCNP1308]MEA5452465.1 sensor histidine kinase [Leptolyngbya sp. CCNP1308]
MKFEFLNASKTDSQRASSSGADLTHPSPLRQLLYVEWVLLGIAVCMTLPSFGLVFRMGVAWLELLTIALLGGVGLWQPVRRSHKLLYTAMELLLLLLLALATTHVPAMMRILPLLGLVVVVRSCQRFKTWGQVVVVAIIFVFHGAAAIAYRGIPLHEDLLQHVGFPPDPTRLNVFQTNAMFVFGLVLVFVSLLVNALLSVYQSQQELAAAHEQLRHYATQIENQATLQERNRIAREIHDSLGHALTAQTILLENALLYLPSQADQARGYLTSAKDSAYQTLRDVSKSVSALRNSPLQEQSLTTAVPLLVDELCKSAGMGADCSVELPETLPDDIKLALFRIVQEAMTNAVKHSRATAVQVKLGAKPSRVYLQVLDNGQGFDPSKNTTGFGLRGMRERAIALGGTCQIWSAPNAGCRISVILPLPAAIDHPA